MLLIFAMAFTLLAGAGLAEESSYFGEGKITDEKITLTAAMTGVDNKQIDTGEDVIWFYEELEKKTNIHVKYDVISEADWSTRVNLMFAAADMPDMFLAVPIDIEEYGVSQGLIVPLDEYINEEIMPNYTSRLSLNDANASIPASDGLTYYIGKLIAQNVNHEGNHFINKTWLDKLGLPIPTTIDELTETLIAFRDLDPNGNGEKDEIPMSANTLQHYVQGIYTHFDGFGVPLVDLDTMNFGYVNIDADDKVQFTPYMPGFRAACEWLNSLYTQGLLDQESMTQDFGTWMTKIADDKVGYFTYLRMLNSGFAPELSENFVSILPPADPQYGASVPAILEVPSMGAVLTVANKYVEETLRWIDAQLETRTMMIAYNGPDKLEGGPTLEDGSPVEPTLALNENGKYVVLYTPEDNGLYDYVPVLNAQFFAPGDYYFDIFEMPPHRVERYEASKAYAEAGVMEPKSYYYLYKFSKMNNENSIETQRLLVELQRLVRESVAGFITNGVTDASWERFLSQAKGIGAERYVDYYQEAYDAYLNK
jgi:putative aldouronate transport system substrate-binding protein